MSSVGVDAFLVVGVALLIFFLLVVNVYVIAHYQHPDDQNQSYFAKLLILFGFMVTSICVLLIPVDVANNEGNPGCDVSDRPSSLFCGGINFFEIYESLFGIACFIVIGLVPFATFYYESSSVVGSTPDKFRFLTALFYQCVVSFGFILILVPLYFYAAETSVAVTEYSYALSNLTDNTITNTIGQSPYEFIDQILPESSFNAATLKKSSSIDFNVTFIIYLIGLAGWIGWWLFSVFTGVGLASMPFDFILSYINRPRQLPPDEYALREIELQERTNDILEITKLLRKDHQSFFNGYASRGEKRKRMLNDRLEVNKLAQMVYILEKDVEALKACKVFTRENNPLIPIFRLISGCLFACVSVLWFLQIVLYMAISPPESYFLNSFLISFDTFFPMFGNIAYAFFSLYLLFCCILGCFKIGLRFLCIKIHPMEINKTYTNSFLFNLAIMMICTIPIVHFCTVALSGYARFSDAYLLFGVQIKYLHFFSTFYTKNIFPYIIIICFGCTTFYLLWKPRDTATSPEDFKQLLYRRGAGEYSTAPSSEPAISGDNPMKKN